LICVHLLPSRSLGSDLLPLLASADPLAERRAALLGERAWIHGVFEDIRLGRGTLQEFGGLKDRPLLRPLLALDESAGLDYVEVLLANLERPWPAASRSLSRLEFSEMPVWSMVSAMSAPSPGCVQSARARQAWIALLAAAIRARDAGVQASREFAEQTADPFGDGPLRARQDADGILVLWSVGADGQDDGGDPGEQGDLDLVVAVRPAR